MSTAYVLVIMVILGILSTIVVPYYLKEYSIPAILRVTNDNMFYGTMRIRTLTYFCFLICAGCVPHLNFYKVSSPCLHTESRDPFGLEWTDKWYFSLVTLLWFVTVPMIMFYLSSVQRDSTRYIFVPFMVAGIVFVFLIFVFGGIVVIFSLFRANDILTQVAFAFCLVVLVYSTIMIVIYRLNYSKRDLIRTDDEEIDVEIE